MEYIPTGYMYVCCVLSRFSCCVQLFSTSWTIAHQAPLPMGFSRQKYWSKEPFPSPGFFPVPGIELSLLCYRRILYSHQGSVCIYTHTYIYIYIYDLHYILDQLAHCLDSSLLILCGLGTASTPHLPSASVGEGDKGAEFLGS